MKKIVQRSYRNFINRRIEIFKQKYSPRNINIRERFNQAKERAKAFAFRKTKKDSQIEQDKQKQLEETKEEDLNEEDDLKNVFADENVQVDEEILKELSEESDTYKRLPLHGQVFAKYFTENPAQTFFVQKKYQDIPHSGIIRITANKDFTALYFQKEREQKFKKKKFSLKQSILDFIERQRKHPVGQEEGEYILQDERRRQKKLKKEKEKLQQNEDVDKALDDIKQNVQETLDKNVVVQQSKKVMDKVKDKMNNEVLDYMKENFPDFNIEIFEEEMEYIFTDIYNAYLNHNLSAIRDTCISEAYGYFQGLIELETSLNGVHKMKAIYNVQRPVLEGSQMIQKQPLFVFSVKFQQIKGLVNAQDPEEYIEGYGYERDWTSMGNYQNI